MIRSSVRRIILIVALAFNTGVISGNGVHAQPTDHAEVTWRALAIGAGGLLTGIDIAPDGTKVVKADAFGAYIWNATTKRWDQLVTATTAAFTTAYPSGVWEIRIAPSLTTRLFMVYDNNLYRSDDRGVSWRKTGLPQMSAANALGPGKFGNQKIAIDPANPDVVYAGTPTNGVWRSFDGGMTWTRLTNIPPGTTPGNAGIAFDPSSGTSDGRTKTIYVPSFGQGVWQSTDAGASWKQIAGATLGGPTKIWTAQVGPDGTYWCSEHEHVWKYSAGTWTERLDSTGRAMSAAAAVVDPKQAGRIIFPGWANGASAGWETLDNGATLVANGKWFIRRPYPGIKQVATDIPWLAHSDNDYMTIGDAMIDPTNGRMYIAQGIGVWWADWPKEFKGFNYISQSLGIEELTTNDIISPPGGKPITATWDRPFFRSEDPDVFPSKYGPIDGVFAAGWSADYASSDPTFIVGIANWWAKEISGYSKDGGETWHQFGAKPPWKPGGCIAAATPLNFVWLPGNDLPPYYTKDGGASWNLAPGLPTDGWVKTFILRLRLVAADRGDIGTFYLYNLKAGLFKSTDGGDHWSLISGIITPYFGGPARLRAAPGHAGHLWFTGGAGYPMHSPAPNAAFRRSIDGGKTWTTIPDVHAIDFGFGKAKTEGGYPAIYIAGWIKSTFGIWRSDDEGNTWSNIGKYPNNNVDMIMAVNGDMNNYGMVYVGFNGSGFAYGKLQRDPATRN